MPAEATPDCKMAHRNSHGLTPAGIHLVRINNVRVVLSSAPIEALAAAGGFDALVSSDDTGLSMGGGVSRAIRLAAGEVIAEEARRLGPLKVGDVAVTSAGALPVRYVLHAVTVDWESSVRPSELTIRLAAENVFRRCELLAVRRLAMPSLGTGAADFTSNQSARLTIEALAKHSLNPTSIEEVVFSLPDTEARRAFSVFLEEALFSREYLGKFGAADSAGPSREGAPITAPGTATATGFFKKLLSRNRNSPSAAPPQAEGHLSAGPKHSRPLIGNRYVLLEELGRGGMAVVYLGWDIVLRQIVAIKTLTPGEHMDRPRIDGLRREAALQIGLVHHGIVRLFNFEPWDSTVGPYIIMEYVPWSSGERWMAEAGLSRLPPQAVLQVGVCLCEALAYAHSANVLHGDINPSNVFVDPAAETAKLADFGIARAVGGVERSALVTRLIGTPGYMAPEQMVVGARVGPRTDIYLLARTLADFVGATVSRNGDVELPDDAAMAASVAVLKRGLAPEPANRPSDAREFGRMLQDALAAA